jgi:flagellar L-ring protein precursor FlgH
MSSIPASPGSLLPANGFRPLFEDRKARAIGDTLTVVLRENTAANRNSTAKSSRSGSVDASISGAASVPFAAGLNGIGITGNGTVETEGEGAASAANVFNGTITVTVLEVLPNGNLVVAGEKRVAVSSDEEVIRFSGVVAPQDIVKNSVVSTQVADARIEYRGSGAADDAQSAGWLTRTMLKLSPF